CEKIGTSNYFWSFPSAALNSRKRKVDDLEAELEQLTKRNEEIKKSIATAQDGREDTDSRTELLATLAELEQRNEEDKLELQKFRECDPVLLQAKDKASAVAKDAANRWTDNIFTVQAYCRDKFMMSGADFNSNFGLPEDFDNIP
ncbi:Meiotic nuclear division protein 1, partial [Tieghemiomyces parasiticus]